MTTDNTQTKPARAKRFARQPGQTAKLGNFSPADAEAEVAATRQTASPCRSSIG